MKKVLVMATVLLLNLLPAAAYSQTATDADSLMQQGVDLYYKGEYDRAAGFFEQSLRIDEQLGDARLMNLGFDYGWIGECARVTGAFEKGLASFARAVEILEEAGQPLYASIYTGNSGWIYKEQKLFDQALPYLLKAFRTANAAGEPTYTALWAGHLAEVYGDLEEYSQAIHYGKISILKAEEAKLDQQIYIAGNNLGNAYLEMELYSEARDAYEKALVIANKYNQTEWKTNQLKNISLSYKNETNWTMAVQFSRKAYTAAKKTGNRELQRDILDELADLHSITLDYPRSVSYYQQALELDRELRDRAGETRRLNNMGKVYSSWGKFQEALDQFQAALDISETLGSVDDLASNYNNIGSVYHQWGKFGDALEYYSMALELDREGENMKDVAIELNNMGAIFETWGEYDKALSHYRQALEIARKEGIPEDEATYLNNIGLVYKSWGDLQKGETYFKRALKIAEQIGDKGMLARYTSNLGLLNIENEKYEQAIEQFSFALKMDEAIGNEVEKAVDLNNLAVAYSYLGNNELARKNYFLALEIARNAGQRDREASYLNNIGKLYAEDRKEDEAIPYYQDALVITRELGNRPLEAIVLNNIGSALFEDAEYEQAIPYFRKAVAILEDLRLTAPGAIRRDYLDSQLHNYGWLILSSMRTGDLWTAFDTAELSTAKYLAEQIQQRLDESEETYRGVEEYAKTLTKDEMIVRFSNLLWPHPLRFTLEQDTLRAAELEKEAFVDTMIDRMGTDITAAMPDEDKLVVLIRYFRHLLSRPISGRREQRHLKTLSEGFYQFLFGGLEEELNSHNKLIIIPDGILAYLPVEALVNEKGEYIAQTHTVSYVQSIKVRELIKHHKTNDGNMLAMGGAVYNADDYAETVELSEAQASGIRTKITELIEEGGVLTESFRSIGYGEWANLPGTLTEVRSIAEIVPGTKILTGESVSEQRIKGMNKDKTLSRYDIIHFATHGVVVPEFPELSAVILTLEGREMGNDDGYLTAREIAGLDINARLVVLSACETGLGKIYGGEGVVGLTQSFLTAGAGGLCVSLWKVSDTATTEFMTGMYALVQRKGLSYGEAINEMKRLFIREGIYAHPFYWAPFVYYGN